MLKLCAALSCVTLFSASALFADEALPQTSGNESEPTVELTAFAFRRAKEEPPAPIYTPPPAPLPVKKEKSYKQGMSVDFLYLKPSVDDTYFVIKNTNGADEAHRPVGKRIQNDFEYKAAFRIAAASDCAGQNGMYLRGAYTRLKAAEKAHVEGDSLIGVVGRPDLVGNFDSLPGAATSKLNLRYQRFDLTLNQSVKKWGRDWFGFLYGAEIANIDFSEFVQYETSAHLIGNIHQKSKMWGGGPQFGFDMGYSIYKKENSSLLFGALVTGSLLVSHTSITGKANAITSKGVDILYNDVKDQPTWRMIPAFHSKLGFTYGHAFKSFKAALTLGYEFNSYVRGIGKCIFYDDVADGLSTNEHNNFDVHGLVVSAGIRY